MAITANYRNKKQFKLAILLNFVKNYYFRHKGGFVIQSVFLSKTKSFAAK